MPLVTNESDALEYADNNINSCLQRKQSNV